MTGMTRRISVRRLVEGALILALAVQAGRLVWSLAAPRDAAPGAAVAAADLSMLSRFDAFFRTGEASAVAAVTGAGSEQHRLFGVRAGGRGGGGAIIGLPDGRQVSVLVGEEVSPGLTLRSVGPDHAVLARGGSLSRIEFGETPMGAAAPPPPPAEPQVVTPQGAPQGASQGAPPAPVPPAAPALDVSALAASGALRPRMRGLAVTGFAVGEAAAAGPLAATGLRPGDVITAIDDVELNGPGRLAEARARLARGGTAVVRFERDGAPQTLTVRTGS